MAGPAAGNFGANTVKFLPVGNGDPMAPPTPRDKGDTPLAHPDPSDWSPPLNGGPPLPLNGAPPPTPPLGEACRRGLPTETFGGAINAARGSLASSPGMDGGSEEPPVCEPGGLANWEIVGGADGAVAAASSAVSPGNTHR